jgi:HAD superfamily hydrolase (TIGR01549 family)
MNSEGGIMSVAFGIATWKGKMPTISAITFDLWDTVLIDDSDEAKRKTAGRPPKRVERRNLVQRFLERQSTVSRSIIDPVYNAADAAFKKVWNELHVTWTVRERLTLILEALGQILPESEMAELVRLHEEMELEFRPDFVPGAAEALRILNGRYRLGVISDTVFSPGRALRTMLADEGLLDLFEVLIFSDEVGRSKPEPEPFTIACDRFGIEPRELVHIGDREDKDVAGSHAIGARAILCTAVIDRGSSHTEAEAVFDDYLNLPKIIEKMDW